MAVTLYLPTDSITSHPIDFNVAADFLELSAFFAETNSAQVSEIKNTIDIGASEEAVDVTGKCKRASEEVISATVDLIDVRGRALGRPILTNWMTTEIFWSVFGRAIR